MVMSYFGGQNLVLGCKVQIDTIVMVGCIMGDGGETRAGVGGGVGGVGGWGGMGGYNNNDCKRDFFTLRR